MDYKKKVENKYFYKTAYNEKCKKQIQKNNSSDNRNIIRIILILLLLAMNYCTNTIPVSQGVGRDNNTISKAWRWILAPPPALGFFPFSLILL